MKDPGEEERFWDSLSLGVDGESLKKNAEGQKYDLII